MTLLVSSSSLYWMTVTSFKAKSQMRSLVSMFWPSPVVTEQLPPSPGKRVRGLVRNSVFVSVSSTLLATAIGTWAPTRWPDSSFSVGLHVQRSAHHLSGAAGHPLHSLYAQIRPSASRQPGGLIVAYPSFTIPS